MRSKGWRLVGPLFDVTPLRAEVFDTDWGGRTGRHRFGPLGIVFTDTRQTNPDRAGRSVPLWAGWRASTGHPRAPVSSRERTRPWQARRNRLGRPPLVRAAAAETPASSGAKQKSRQLQRRRLPLVQGGPLAVNDATLAIRRKGTRRAARVAHQRREFRDHAKGAPGATMPRRFYERKRLWLSASGGGAAPVPGVEHDGFISAIERRRCAGRARAWRRAVRAWLRGWPRRVASVASRRG